MQRVRSEVGDARYESGHYEEAKRLFDEISTAETFTEFLTLPAYDRLVASTAR
jgi:malate synthase